MADLAPDHPPLRDVLDFLDWAQGQEGRHEFVDGRIVAMAGASRRHNDIQINLIGELRDRLRGGPCRVNGSDLLIRTDPAGGRFADASIECGPPGHERLSEAPLVVIEILSPETEAADRGTKLREYQSLPSLAHHVLLAQDAVRAELYSRQGNGDGWLYRRHEGAAAVLVLDPPGLALPLAGLYEGIEPATA